MKKIIGLIGSCIFITNVYAADITLSNTSTTDNFSLEVNISGVQNSVSDLHYTGLDGATTLSSQMLVNQSSTSGNFNSRLIIVPNKSGVYNVTASANVDGKTISSNKVSVTVSDAQLKQIQAQVHQVESQTIQQIKADMPIIKQEVQQQQQFINDLSNAINEQK